MAKKVCFVVGLFVFLLVQQVTANCVHNCYCPSNEEVDCSHASMLQLPNLSEYIKTFNASYNRIAALKKDSFYQLINTGKERYTNNNITGTIDHFSFKGQTRLEVIDMSWNSIIFVHPEVFAFTPKLMWLSFAYNKALDLPESGLLFIGKFLKILNLSHCNISTLGEYTFRRGKHNLKELYLQHNIISTVHKDALVSFTNLQVLDLSHNRLTSLEVMVLIPLKEINIIKLQNNPWSCDCVVNNVFSWSVNHRLDVANTTCVMPFEEISVPWREGFNDMHCGTRSRRHAVAEALSGGDSKELESGTTITFIIIGVLVAIVVLVALCACLLNNSHECMEAAGCLLICHHCYQ